MRIMFCLEVVVLVAMAGVADAQTRYHFEPLNALSGHDYCEAIAINDNGLIVGRSESFAGGAALVSWQAGSISALAHCGAGESFVPYGVNSLGQVVGTFIGMESVAFIYDPGTGVKLQSMDIPRFASINDAGVAAGGLYDWGSGTATAITYSQGRITYLSNGSGYGGGASDINNPGQVAGGIDGHAAVWPSATAPVVLESHASYSSVVAISDDGVVAGLIRTGAEPARAFVVTPVDTNGDGLGDTWYRDQNGDGVNDLIEDLGAFNVWGMNNAGQIIGSASGAPVLWNDGQLYDLRELADVPEGWTLGGVRGINNSGRIVGSAISPEGQTRAVLLTPVPEPGTLALLAVGLLGARRRRA